MEACTYLMLAKMLYNRGIDNVVVSSGSRNAAIVDLLGKMPGGRIATVLDERIAGFYALGFAKSTNAPVVLVCTSGSAMLNYGAAIAEAAKMRVPLIVVSADRPAEVLDANVGQTIHQNGLYSEFFKYSVDLDGVVVGDDAVYNAVAKLSQALNIADSCDCGPVHINLHITEPAPIFDCFPVERDDFAAEIAEVKNLCLCQKDIDSLYNSLNGKRVIIYDGHPGALGEAEIDELSQRGFIVISETLLSTETGFSPDLFLAAKPRDWEPDYVIYMGCAPMNREYISWLKGLNSLKTCYVSPSGDCPNTFGHLDKIYVVEPRHFIKALLQSTILAFGSQDIPHIATLGEILALPWCDLKATAMIFDALNGHSFSEIHSSNGMTLRNLSLISGLDCAWWVYANRGVNGIEGSTSTAIGFCEGCNIGNIESGTLLFTGDMSAAYDIGALFAFRPANFHIVVFNNGGGEIFRRIKNTRNLVERERLIAGMHPVDWQAVAAAAGYRRFRAASQKELSAILPAFLAASPAPSLLEIVTEPGNSSNYDLILHKIKQLYNK